MYKVNNFANDVCFLMSLIVIEMILNDTSSSFIIYNNVAIF